ncbi:hypothetical protein ATI61_108338 [Archangium gephyra]|uniref:Uncharacterized protein n=1 Tax=Archangium gephyra TaxID=48 RepID=A0AAC8Q856_9BACT|nr:hypothetical protein [Archangium gephyra]AKJ02273.1 Hypothetical protein AA314_03899 [Archangium gephyra]REG28796.1 hypothetical protein ATI61_108338 [Archangium gephyra]
MNTPFRPLPFLNEARAELVSGVRLQKLRRAAQEARDAFTAGGPVAAVATCDLVTFPYPSLFAFSGGALSPAPYVMMTNRMQVVQYMEDGATRTLLFNPSDYERGQEAPFFKSLREKYGDFVSDKVMTRRHGTVQSHLTALGLKPEDVDYIAFDHLHVQDVRRWLGGDGEPAYFPRAKLLVQRAEWESVKNLHPFEKVWYVPGGTDGVPEERVVLLDGDTWLGRGAAILSTPGHTMGNMSLAVATDKEVFVVSENGVASESYTPLQSRIPGVRAFAEQMGWEVVLNGNTRESSLEQYTSMVVEKVFAGPSRVEGAFVNFHPSSLLTGSLVAPGLSPTITLPAPNHGDIRPTAAARRAA